jgi:hypothetical protein
MPVIINEIEVLEPPATETPGQGPAPAPAAPVVLRDGLIRLLCDAEGRQRRLVAD